MKDDYLQDPRAEPDEEIAELERLLARRRYRPVPLEANEPARERLYTLAAAALFVAAVSVTLLVLHRDSEPNSGLTHPSDPTTATLPDDVERNDRSTEVTPAEPYPVEGLEGIPVVAAGASLDVPEGTEARIVIAKLGEVVVSGAARIAVLENGPKLHRLRLEFGRAEASIFAPERTFMIDTPSGNTVDLGCRYVITVDADGNTAVEVKLGTIAFEREGRSVLLPKDTVCAGRPDDGPGIPYWNDSDPSLVRAVQSLEFRTEADGPSLAVLGSVTRRRDTLILFHLLEHRDPAVRQRSLDTIRKMSILSDGFLTTAHVQRDRTALAALRDELRYFWY